MRRVVRGLLCGLILALPVAGCHSGCAAGGELCSPGR